MSGFSIDWLNLREPADRRARNDGLLDQARQWLDTNATTAGATVVDLGAGTGATVRALTTADGEDHRSLNWRLVDNDPVVLAEASRRHGGSHQVATYELDLTDIDKLPLQGARLVSPIHFCIFLPPIRLAQRR